MTPRSIRYFRRRKENRFWENRKKVWHALTRDFYKRKRETVIYESFDNVKHLLN